MVVLSLFIAGFSLLCTSMNLPFGFESDYDDGTNRTLAEKIDQSQDTVQPFLMFEILFFALFGMQTAKDLLVSTLIQGWTIFLFKLVFPKIPAPQKAPPFFSFAPPPPLHKNQTLPMDASPYGMHQKIPRKLIVKDAPEVIRDDVYCRLTSPD